MLRFLRARTGFEWGLYWLGPPLLVYGLITGQALLLGKSGAIDAGTADRPWWYWGIMIFHAVCSMGLYVSLRERSRNKGRWFVDR
jgi:hypothetical protein